MLPKDEELLLIMEKKRIKAYKREHEGKYDKSFGTQEYAPYHFVDTEQEFKTLVIGLRP